MKLDLLTTVGLVLWPLAIGAAGLAGYAFIVEEKPTTTSIADAQKLAFKHDTDKRFGFEGQPQSDQEEKMTKPMKIPSEKTTSSQNTAGNLRSTDIIPNEVRRERNAASEMALKHKPDPLKVYKCFGMISILNEKFGPNDVVTFKLAISATVASKILEENGVPPNGITQYMNNLIQFERKKTLSLMQAGVNFSADAETCNHDIDMAVDYGHKVLGIGR